MAGKKIRGITIELGADTTQFQKEMNGLDKSLNSTQRELRDVDKLLKFDPKNTTLLAQKQDLLKSAISDTDEKLQKEREALEKLKKADKSPEVEKQMRALERQIVDDENKMQNFNKELKETDKASSGVEKAKDRFKKFGKGLGSVGKAVGGTVKIGAAAVASITTASVAAGKAIGNLASDSAEAGDEIDKMSQKLGMSRKGYQEWGFVLGQAGVDINSLQTGMKTMTNQIGAAKNGTSASVEAFNKLGISMEELQGMSREDAFAAIVKGMQGMEDSTERAALANQLFGKSGQNLTPLFNETAEGTQELINKANELGMVMGDDAVNAAVNFQDQLDGLKRTFEATKNGVSSQMLPAITDIMGGLQSLMVGDTGGADKIEQGFTSLFDNIGKILSKATMIFEPVFNALLASLPTIFTELGNAILTYLPQLITAFSTMINTMLTSISENSADFTNSIVQIVSSLCDLIIQNLPLILSVGVQVILELAKGIAQALPTMIPEIINVIMTICSFIVENLPLIIDAGIQILLGLLDGIINALPQLLAYIPKLIKQVLTAIGKILPKLWDLAKKMFSKLTEPFKNIATWFGDRFKQAWKNIKSAFSKVGEFFGGIWDKIKKRFSEVGTKVAEAIGSAFKTAINAVIATVEGAINLVPKAINGAIGLINKLPGVEISEIPLVELPRLAKGGVTTAQTAAIIGDNPSHNEAVLPLNDPRTVELFRKALVGVGGGTVNQTINVGQMSSYREAYMIKRATEQGLKRMMRA